LNPPRPLQSHPCVQVLALLVALTFCRSATAMQILIPAYFYPAETGSSPNPWQVLATSATAVGITAILNPASGPGTIRDDSYAAAVAILRGNGGKVIGYVSTGYGHRDASAVEAEIARYRSWYDIDGIFLDEMSNLAAQLGYYRGLHDYIRGLDSGYRIIGNPGTNTLEGYLQVADTLVTFENGAGYPTYQPDGWVDNHAADRFAHLIYDVGSAALMQQFIALAAQRNAGYLYVTDDSGTNPWDRLPTYWQAQAEAVATVPVPAAAGLLASALAAMIAALRRWRRQ
jgi:hypothetical protein